MSDERTPLPPRRQNQSVEFLFDGLRYQLTIGFYGNGRIGEVWLNGPRSDSALYHITQDGCVLLSHLLQRYVSPEAIAESLPRRANGEPASILGAIVMRLIELGGGA